MVDVPDAISLTLLLTYIIPIVLTCYNTKYFVLFVALVFVWLSVEAIKPFIPSPRPPNATKCDRWCVKGPVGGQPGFPSGHMASVAVLVALLYYHFPSLVDRRPYLALIDGLFSFYKTVSYTDSDRGGNSLWSSKCLWIHSSRTT
jgi:membrane-associated phospholipid phosphatase